LSRFFFCHARCFSAVSRPFQLTRVVTPGKSLS
jgi:hypothetical protein